jgi:glycosyltransferase involved in cell wall biosynthesis
LDETQTGPGSGTFRLDEIGDVYSRAGWSLRGTSSTPGSVVVQACPPWVCMPNKGRVLYLHIALEKRREVAMLSEGEAKPIKPSKHKPVLANVSLICTVLNEAKSIRDFLDSIVSSDCYPAEVVVVDGGSSDGTAEIVRSYQRSMGSRLPIKLVVDLSCNRKVTPSPVAKGRNVAIANSSHEVIACTDAGCVLNKNWLDLITGPLRHDLGNDVVGGWYISDARTFLEKCIANVFLVPPQKVKHDNFLPSSRSIAFRKPVWEKVGGYPETSLTAEDTLFILRLREVGIRITCVPEALVRWRMKRSIGDFIRLVYGYGFGDGFNRILFDGVIRACTRLSIALFLLVIAFLISPWFFGCLAVYWWLMPLNKRLNEAFRIESILAFPVHAFLKVIADSTYLLAYCVGRVSVQPLVLKKLD